MLAQHLLRCPLRLFSDNLGVVGMKYRWLWAATSLLALVALSACNDNTLAPTPTEVGTGGLSGRVCGPSGQHWLADASVYIPIYDDTGEMVMQPETLTDLDGYFTLMGIPEGTWTLHVVKNSFSTEQEVEIVADQVTELEEPTCIDPYSAHVAVVTGQYDRVEDVIDRVGLTDVTIYDGVGSGSGTPASTLLNDLSLLAEYDVVFLNCGMVETGLIDDPNVISNLRTFVESGGSLYASDWAYDYVEVTWPDAIEFWGDDNTVDAAAWGIDGTIQASVDDSALSTFLGQSSVQLNYDLGAWVVAESAAPSTRVLVRGAVEALDNSNPFLPQIVPVNSAPLLMMFEHGDGKVMYTTFHNESQTTADMDIILEFMVFEL